MTEAVKRFKAKTHLRMTEVIDASFMRFLSVLSEGFHSLSGGEIIWNSSSC
jgi:hypothetical protein